jgi:hypothetical protein
MTYSQGEGLNRVRLAALLHFLSLCLPRSPMSSGDAERGQRMTPSEESDQAFGVLSRRRQEKLLGHVPEAPQPDPAKADALLELARRTRTFLTSDETVTLGFSASCCTSSKDIIASYAE